MVNYKFSIMKTRTLDLAEEWGLNIVEITQGINGYPKGLYKALMGFDIFEDAECFAEEVNGEVVLLTRRDGHQLWFNRGRQFEALERAKFIDEETEDVYTCSQCGDFVSWAKGEIENMLREGCDLVDIREASDTMCDTFDEIYRMEGGEVAIVNRMDYTCRIEDYYATTIHDDDVTTYAIAVVDHETDEDETNEEEEE